MPNDEIISGFAHKSIGKDDSAKSFRLSKKMFHVKGNRNETAKYLAVVKERSPELAERYAYLEGDKKTRAGSEGETNFLIWVDEE